MGTPCPLQNLMTYKNFCLESSNFDNFKFVFDAHVNNEKNRQKY